MNSLDDIKRDNDTGCHREDDGRRCSRSREHTGPCKFRGLRRSAQLARAREVIAEESCTLVIEVSPQVMGALEELRDTGYFGGPEPTVESVAYELLRATLRQNQGFIK